MADTMTARPNGLTDAAVQPEDLVSVRSRISWGAVVAGSVFALSMYFLLTLLGGAIGLSVESRVDPRALSIGAAVYAIVITALCLFVGGGLASQLTAGENRKEACVYGLMVWATVFAMLLWLMATGVRIGFNTMIGLSTTTATAANAAGTQDWEEAARQAGVSQQQIDDMKNRTRDAANRAREAVEDPAKRAQVASDVGDASTRVAWYTFVGTLVSMVAAAAGGYVGAGPSFRLFNVPPTRTVIAHREIIVPRS